MGFYNSLLSFLELDDNRRRELITKLSEACKETKTLDINDSIHHKKTYNLQHGLRKASAIALSLGLRAEASAISHCAPNKRPDVWSFRDHFFGSHVFPFLFHVSLLSAITGEEVHEKDILPTELTDLCTGIDNSVTSAEFRKKLKERLEQCARPQRDGSDANEKTISYDTKHQYVRFIDDRLEPLLSLTKALPALLGAPVRKADKAFVALLDTWAETRKVRGLYSTEELNIF